MTSTAQPTSEFAAARWLEGVGLEPAVATGESSGLVGVGGVPRVVCLCGSSKWPETHMRVMMEETLAGKIVVPMGLYGHADFPAGARAATNDGDEATAVKQMLDRLHFAKIDLADEILVVNVGGYIGSSTRREIAHAEATGKLVRYTETPQPTYVDLWDAFVCGAREARMNPTADEKAFNRAADGYCKLVHSQKDPAMFASLGGGGAELVTKDSGDTKAKPSNDRTSLQSRAEGAR